MFSSGLLQAHDGDELSKHNDNSQFSCVFIYCKCLFSSYFQSLLSDPNPNSPANSMAAQLYKENRREYEKRVKACVEQSFID